MRSLPPVCDLSHARIRIFFPFFFHFLSRGHSHHFLLFSVSYSPIFLDVFFSFPLTFPFIFPQLFPPFHPCFPESFPLLSLLLFFFPHLLPPISSPFSPSFVIIPSSCITPSPHSPSVSIFPFSSPCAFLVLAISIFLPLFLFLSFLMESPLLL